MRIIILKNKGKVQPFEPDWIAKVKIDDEWKDVGTGKTAISKQDTDYMDLDLDSEILVEKLRDIDWKPKGEKAGRFVKELTDERMKRDYPQLFEEKLEQDFQDY